MVVCVCACVRACVHACVCVCVWCMRVCTAKYIQPAFLAWIGNEANVQCDSSAWIGNEANVQCDSSALGYSTL